MNQSERAELRMLTQAQRDFLRMLGLGDRSASMSYSPANKLVSLGLATRHTKKGYLSTDLFKITAAGRAALSTPPEHGEK